MEDMVITDPQFHGATALSTSPPSVLRLPNSSSRNRVPTYFSAQSYLRYQGEKFIKRFDANCYIAITRKLDTHDVSLHCPPTTPDGKESSSLSGPERLALALNQIQQPTLVLGIESDGLFTFAEQAEIAAGIPDARLEKIESPEGHDAFLLQFEQVNKYILEFLRVVLPDLWQRKILDSTRAEVDDGLRENSHPEVDQVLDSVTKNSVFGEAEVEDITAW